jgi:hypothetical protein
MQRNRIIKIVNIIKHLPRTSEEYPQYLLRILNFAIKNHNFENLFQKFTALADSIDKSDTIDFVVKGSKETESLKSSTSENISKEVSQKILKIYFKIESIERFTAKIYFENK